MLINTTDYKLFLYIRHSYCITCLDINRCVMVKMCSLQAGLSVSLWHLHKEHHMCILIIWSLVISIPCRSLGLDSHWLTCLVNISICLPLSSRSSREITLIYTSLSLTQAVSISRPCCVEPLSSLALVADQLGNGATVFHSRGAR